MWSDHAAVSIMISEENSSHSTWLWHCNTKLLREPSASDVLLQWLCKYFCLNHPSDMDATTLWSTHKAYICGIMIQFGAREKRCKSAKIQNINFYSSTRHPKPDLVCKRSNLRIDLRSLLNEHHDGCGKLKLKYCAQGNRAEAFYSSWLKAQRVKFKIHYLFHPSSKQGLTNLQSIGDAFVDYYTSLTRQPPVWSWYPSTLVISNRYSFRPS